MSSFSFGAPKAQTPATGGFSFGGSPAPAASLSFGAAPAAQPAPLSFGAAPAAQPAPLSFGAAPAAQPAATGFSFGAPTAAAAPATGGFSFGATSTAPTLGATASGSAFGFKPTGTVAPVQTSLSFGSAPAAQPAAPLFGAPAASTQPAGLFNLSATATTLGTGASALTLPAPAPVLGLGGVDINANQPKTVEGKQDGAKVREAQLPQEIASTIDTLKAYIKQQKTISSDIARTSQRRLNYVATETQNVKSTLSELADSVESNCFSIKALRAETGQVIHHAEMAQRTHETPPGLQFENTAPLMYFAELVHKFENDLITFKNQVELTEKHMRSLANPQSFTGQDLKQGLQQIHECFIALAGRHHEIHQKVEAQKELYLKLRKYFLNDRTDVFAATERKTDGGATSSAIAGVGVGPTPFSNLLLTLPHSPQNQNQSVGQTPTMSGAAPGFGTTAAAPSFSFGNQTTGTFDLQKPPLGGKRNKAFF